MLNAVREEEASIVAQAGEPGRVTVATNMAGRGTDIRLAPESIGGLLRHRHRASFRRGSIAAFSGDVGVRAIREKW